MTSVADCAPAEANEGKQRRGPSPWITALLTVLTPGLGHIYLGQARRGITLFVLVMIADTLLMFAMMGVLARFWMFAVSLGLLLAHIGHSAAGPEAASPGANVAVALAALVVAALFAALGAYLAMRR